MLDAKRVV